MTPRTESRKSQDLPHVVVFVQRGLAARSVYARIIPALARNARVTLVTMAGGESWLPSVEPLVENVITPPRFPEKGVIRKVRDFITLVHSRYFWNGVQRNQWERLDELARTPTQKLRRALLKAVIRLFAHRRVLDALNSLERYVTWRLRPTRYYDELFERLDPNLIYDGSQVHKRMGYFMIEVAQRQKVRSVGFIHSWDQLTTRGPLFSRYDHYLVWTDGMRRELMEMYAHIRHQQVTVTGTPQFDFHFDPRYRLQRSDLCERIGIDPALPYVLYTAQSDQLFPHEHGIVELISKALARASERHQLVVRLHPFSDEGAFVAVAERSEGVVVLPGLADFDTAPTADETAVYTSLLAHAALGINGASTVSIELLIHGKGVINLGFDPPGAHLPGALHYERHIAFDHFRPLVESGAVMVARSAAEFESLILRALSDPDEGRPRREAFLKAMFGNQLDARAGERVAEAILAHAGAPAWDEVASESGRRAV